MDNREMLKRTAKSKIINSSHSAIYIKELNKLDKQLDILIGMLEKKRTTLYLSLTGSTTFDIDRILNHMKDLKKNLVREKQMTKNIREYKFHYPKRKALTHNGISTIEGFIRAMSQRNEIPY